MRRCSMVDATVAKASTCRVVESVRCVSACGQVMVWYDRIEVSPRTHAGWGCRRHMWPHATCRATVLRIPYITEFDARPPAFPPAQHIHGNHAHPAHKTYFAKKDHINHRHRTRTHTLTHTHALPYTISHIQPACIYRILNLQPPANQMSKAHRRGREPISRLTQSVRHHDPCRSMSSRPRHERSGVLFNASISSCTSVVELVAQVAHQGQVRLRQLRQLRQG